MWAWIHSIKKETKILVLLEHLNAVSEHNILKYKGTKLVGFFFLGGEDEAIIIFPIFFPERMYLKKK